MVHTTRIPADSALETLKISIRKVGQMLPVYYWQGQIIDGRKRRQACLQLGIYPEEHTCETEAEAKFLLWQLHPKRALHRWPQASAAAAESEFAARRADYHRTKALLDASKAPNPAPRSRDGSRCKCPSLAQTPKRLNLWIGSGVYNRLTAAARESGLSLTDTARACIDLVASNPQLILMMRSHWLVRKGRESSPENAQG